jgi:hypothetical protein
MPFQKNIKRTQGDALAFLCKESQTPRKGKPSSFTDRRDRLIVDLAYGLWYKYKSEFDPCKGQRARLRY